MLMDCAKLRRRLRAPREHGEILVEPPLSESASLLGDNIDARTTISYSLQGRDLVSLSNAARTQLVAAAQRYTATYRDVELACSDFNSQTETPIILAGHQPELFHLGVWFKNLVLGSLARQHSAVAVNLLIDNDACRTAAVRVPGGSAASPTVTAVELDQTPTTAAVAVQPYEERSIRDLDQFASFGQRASKILRPLVAQPLLESYWPLAVERAKATGNLGLAIAQSRHQLEGIHQVQTLELPLSEVCSLEAFHWFVAHLLAQLPRFWDLYNASLADYRQAHRLRSHAHPVPDLTETDGWLEAPFWIWTTNDPTRKPLFVRTSGDKLVLSDRQAIRVTLDLSPDSDADVAVAQLAELQTQGIKLRPRALVTTMFARLMLGDLFLHGIGGAKYDELTDQIICRFFQIQPPRYLILSATMQLPIEHTRPHSEQEQQLKQDLRRLTYHPERFIEQIESVELQNLITEKKRWIQTEMTPANAHQRHETIHRVNTALQPWVAERREQLLIQQTQLATALRHDAILASREYAFCLHPRESLEYLIAPNFS